METASVSVVIPAHNAAATIGSTLDGLAAQDFRDGVEVIVADNASTDGTGELARESPVVSAVVRLEGLGPADSRNAGVGAAGGRLIAFIDSDCRPTPGWLGAGVVALERADLVQGMTLPDPDAPVGPFDRTLTVRRANGLFESANMFLTRELFDRVGGFRHFEGVGRGQARPFGEDVLFGWRARRLGARTGFCDQALAHHAVFAGGLAEYVRERKRLRFFPELALEVPELREEFFYKRWFLGRRSAAFDLALAGIVLAGALRKPAALALAAPYAAQISDRVLGGSAWHAVKMLAAEVAADSVGLAALCAGTARTGAPVL